MGLKDRGEHRNLHDCPLQCVPAEERSAKWDDLNQNGPFNRIRVRRGSYRCRSITGGWRAVADDYAS